MIRIKLLEVEGRNNILMCLHKIFALFCPKVLKDFFHGQRRYFFIMLLRIYIKIHENTLKTKHLGNVSGNVVIKGIFKEGKAI